MAQGGSKVSCRLISQAMLEGYLSSHNLQICPGHGICYEVGGEYRHLLSPEESEAEFGRRLHVYIRKRCLREGIDNRWPCSIKELGERAKELVDSGSRLANTEAWCSVGTKKKLLYFCGCNVQPMRKNSFERHLHAEGNRHKCCWNLCGKSELAALILGATALECCKVRCVRAKCGLLIIRDRIAPDVSKLSKHIRKIKASRMSQVDHKSDSGSITGNLLSETLAKVEDVGAKSTLQTAIEIGDSAEDTAEAQAESEDTTADTTTIPQPSKPVILLLGFTFRKETTANGPTYEELLDEARAYYGKDKTQLPGAIRDKARIVRLRDAGFDCFCVSKSNKDENVEGMHYYGDFCDRNFVQELRGKLDKHPVQVCVDWVYCPIGWDTSKYLKPQFFTKTLPNIASVLCSDAIEIEGNNQRVTRKRRTDEKSIPSGVIFLPFTLGVLAELFKALAAVERKYTVSYLDREQLMVEHPMYAATASISDSDMMLLNKNPRPEDGYATDLFKNIDAGVSRNIDSRKFKRYVMSNCSEETRMIKLTLKDDN